MESFSKGGVNNTNNQSDMLLDILKEAISIEIYGKEYYSIFSDIVEDDNPKALFRELSKYEAKHQELIEKEYKRISGRSIDIKVLDEENTERARRIFPEPLRPLNIEETKDVLKLGIKVEERSIELYSGSAQKTEDISARDLFLRLVHFEEGHKETLIEALDHLEQVGSWYGYSPLEIEG
ncbi:MAG: ferritin family protein [Candidatus Methanoperedens sp.]|nr:ferritin family protein [Candidatus Methanoperedens nitroreducens]MDJ1423555.1 ferritin family protein [Candidatus Methanoperedens sp.]